MCGTVWGKLGRRATSAEDGGTDTFGGQSEVSLVRGMKAATLDISAQPDTCLSISGKRTTLLSGEKPGPVRDHSTLASRSS